MDLGALFCLLVLYIVWCGSNYVRQQVLELKVISGLHLKKSHNSCRKTCQVVMDTHSRLQDSHGAEGSGPDAYHATFVNGEETPYSHLSAPTSCYGYPAMKWLEQTKPGDAQYEKLNSHPSNAQSSLQGKKDGVTYAELGSRPANAPPVLPLDTSVHYMTVKKSPTP